MKCIITAIAAAIVLSVQPIQAFAMDDSIDGGWIEGQGYFTNTETLQEVASASTFDDAVPRSKPDHQGFLETKAYNGVVRKRMIARTTWSGVRHYTMAILKKGSRTVENSGKRWGRSKTAAVTPWWNVTASGQVTGESYFGYYCAGTRVGTVS